MINLELLAREGLLEFKGISSDLKQILEAIRRVDLKYWLRKFIKMANNDLSETDVDIVVEQFIINDESHYQTSVFDISSAFRVSKEEVGW